MPRRRADSEARESATSVAVVQRSAMMAAMAGSPVTLPNARLSRDANGTPYSPEFGDVYHSTQGGLAQARHVFLAGNDLPARWANRASFTIVETGFGIGLNFLTTWDAWRADAQRPKRLHFVSTENRPFACEELREALAPFAPLESLVRALTQAWPPALAGFHRLHFESSAVALTLLLGEAEETLPQLVGRADAFYLDGFAPARNPQLWTPAIVRELARIARPDATLATWTVAGGVRTALADAGFRIEKRPGFGTKREMLCGVRDERGAEEAAWRPARHAIVVGAGLAGSLCTERLAAREWEVELLESSATPGAALPAALVRPIANLRDALNARLSRSAFLYAVRHFEWLQAQGATLDWNPCGVLQLAQDAEEATRFETIARSQGHPADFLAFVDVGEASRIAGHVVRGPAWWFQQGAVVAPGKVARASVECGGERVRVQRGAIVARLEREGGQWRAYDAQGRMLAEAPVVILANAADARRLAPEARLSLSRVRGQLTLLPPDPARRLSVAVSGNGYVAPLPGGGHAVGATYQHDDDDPAVRTSEQRENLERADTMLPGFTVGLEPGGLDGWTGFRATVPDRLPITGATAIPGVHAFTGLGSRGLLWAPLGAEILVSALEDEPLPVPRDLAGAASPRRFLS